MKHRNHKFLFIIFLLLAMTASGCSRIPESALSPVGADGAGTPALQILPDASGEPAPSPAPVPTPEPTPVPTPTPEPTPTPFPVREISLMAVGDNLMHMGVVHTGKQSDGTRDYSFLFEGIRPFLDAAKIKVINQETILGGNERGFSGFPHFNSPTEVGDSIAAAGFNVVLQASNHSADQGVEGLIHCAEFWDKYPDVLMTGIYADKENTGGIPLLTVDDITFAILNYTYSPNMEVIPEELEGHLEFLSDYDPETNQLHFTRLNPKVIEDIEEAENLADIVIVFPHWGTEYTTTPSRYQEQFAMEMTRAGADLIIGTHPHVIQPVEWVEADNGNRSLCYYSLGNYVSTQKGAQSMLEAMAWVTFLVEEEGISIREDRTGALPMVCHYSSGPVRIKGIYLLENYTAEQAASHGIRSYGGVTLTLEDLNSWSQEILGDWILSAGDALAP